MYNNAIDLILKRRALCFGIFTDAWNTYIDLSLDHSPLAHSEGDNVGIGIMVEELLVDAQEVFITAEDIIEIAQPAALVLYDGFNPFPGFSGMRRAES